MKPSVLASKTGLVAVVLLVFLIAVGCSDTPEAKSLKAGNWTALMATVKDGELHICLDTSVTLAIEPGMCAFDDLERNPVASGGEATRMVAELPDPERAGQSFRGEFTAKRLDGKWELTGFRNLVFWTPPGS